MNTLDEGLQQRVSSLYEIAFGNRRGSVEGVYFDMTLEPNIDWSHWELPGGMSWLDHLGSCYRSGDGPFIAWPWSNTPLPETVRAEAIKIADSSSSPNRRGRRKWIDEYVARATPDFVVNVGDTIKIKNAVINVSRVYLDPSEDLDELKVYLAVIRNGETIPIAKPLTYRRAGYISSSWWGFAPYRLLERARKRAGVKSAEDHAVLLAAELDVLPMQEVYLLFDMAVGDLERLKVDIESSQRPGFDVAETQHGFGSMTDRIERLAAAFSRAGYAMAQVEAKTNLLPLAERGLTADQSQAKASAERRKAGDPVREAARSDIAVNPKTTQTACARRVATALGRDQRSVEKLIAPLFEWRDLPGGGREKRGMR